MKMLFVALALFASLALAQDTVPELRDKNRASLNRLSPGMSKADVLLIMATQSVEAGRGYTGVSMVTNPYRTETLLSEDRSKVLGVLFYYTQETQQGGWRARKTQGGITITNEDLTPLVLEGGKLRGWGWT